MKNKRIKSVLVCSLIIIEGFIISLTYKSYSNKPLDDVKSVSNAKKQVFSMYIENASGEYDEYVSSELFPAGYSINLNKSSCIDINSNEVKEILSGSDSTVTVTSNKTVFCHIYFDKKPKLSELCNINDKLSECIIGNEDKLNDVWNSTLEDDGYRYIGTNPDNYICFGTSDKDECINDTDKYMYRIIGVFEDDGKQYIKLIKKETLNTAYAWNSDTSVDVEWDNSDLYNGINGDYFKTNTSYPYMQNEGWTDKIATWSYTMTNTKTVENNGPDYYHMKMLQIYLHELNKSGKSSNVGTWYISGDKIGLMYVSDYALSLGEVALNYVAFKDYNTMKTGWMHLSNNDSGTPSSIEWTMTRHGSDGGVNNAWGIISDGSILEGSTEHVVFVRPVFYLEYDEVYNGGDGTIDNPIMLSKPPITKQVTVKNLVTSSQGGPGRMTRSSNAYTISFEIIEGHKYYIYARGGDYGDANGYCAIHCDALGAYEKNNENSASNNWMTRISGIYTASSTTTATLTFDEFGYGTNISGNYIWRYGANAYDLTDAFGVGNEPDLAWCEENLTNMSSEGDGLSYNGYKGDVTAEYTFNEN